MYATRRPVKALAIYHSTSGAASRRFHETCSGGQPQKSSLWSSQAFSCSTRLCDCIHDVLTTLGFHSGCRSTALHRPHSGQTLKMTELLLIKHATYRLLQLCKQGTNRLQRCWAASMSWRSKHPISLADTATSWSEGWHTWKETVLTDCLEKALGLSNRLRQRHLPSFEM